jgi:hypothetical protein
MDLLKQCQFFGVKAGELADATGFTYTYVRQVLKGERRNELIETTTKAALRNRKEELRQALKAS